VAWRYFPGAVSELRECGSIDNFTSSPWCLPKLKDGHYAASAGHPLYNSCSEMGKLIKVLEDFNSLSRNLISVLN